MEVVSVEAVLAQVTVYASGARVRRVTTVNGSHSRVRIRGLPVAVIDDTVRVEIEGPAIATAVRVGVDAPPAEAAADEESRELRAARHALQIAETEVERVTAAIERLANAPIVEDDPSEDAPPSWAAVIAARRSVVALRAERELELAEELASARRVLAEAQRLFTAEADRDRRAGSMRTAKLHELRKHVELELAATAAGELTITLEYQVGAARWAPSYVARLDGERTTLELRAVVAQDTGEDWTRVPLRLSTAEPEQFATLPELPAQRIGRRQQEPAKPGFRAPPVGAAALYADYDRALKRASPATAAPPAPSHMLGGLGELEAENWDEESSRAKDAFPADTMTRAPFAAAPPPPPAAPQAVRHELAKSAAVPRGAPGGAAIVAKKAHVPRPATPRLDYANLRMAAPTSPARGTLVPAERDPRARALDGEVTSAHARLVALPLPPGHVADWSHAYDYAFATDGAVDVASDGTWHSIAVTAQAATARLRHISVPREQADVFRIAAIANPFSGPLLPGPIDVYDRGRFLVTSEVDTTPPGGTVEVGLGVDAAVKIARNTQFHEEAAGMLRGALRLHHAITIDIDNLSGRAIDLEVRERVPVTQDGDDEIEVKLVHVEPPWERWTPEADGPHARRLRGGYRWRAQLPAGEKRTLRAGYEVKIAGKLELVGGNRREA